MFKLVSVNINEGVMNILDTVDGVTDSLLLEDVQSILDLGVVSIKGINTEGGEISIDKDVEILDTQEEESEDDYEEDENDYSDFEDEDVEGYGENEDEDDGFGFEDEDEDEFYEDISKTNMYSSIPEEIAKIIKDYYKWYTKELYHNLASTIRLGISNKKAEQLANIKNRGDFWSFEGIYDTGEVCSCCTLGHDIRYEYHAMNEHGETIIFGRDCAGDFFNLDKEQLKNLNKAQNKMTAEAIECINSTVSGKVGIGKEGIDLLYGVLFRLDENNMLGWYLPKQLVEFVEKFVNNGIALPESMVKVIRRNIVKNFYDGQNYEISRRVKKDVVNLLVDLFGAEYKVLSLYFEEGVSSQYRCTAFSTMLCYVLVNLLDGKYAHNPVTGVCKEEGSCRKERRYSWSRATQTIRKVSSLPKGVDRLITFEEFEKSVTFYLRLADVFDALEPLRRKYKLPIGKILHTSTACQRVSTKYILDFNSTTEELTQYAFYQKHKDELQYFEALGDTWMDLSDTNVIIEDLQSNKELYLYWVSKALELNYASNEEESSNSNDVQSSKFSTISNNVSNSTEDSEITYKTKTNLNDAPDIMKEVKGIINAHENYPDEFSRHRKDFYFNIASTVMRYGSFTPKQLKYINEGYRWIMEMDFLDKTPRQ